MLFTLAATLRRLRYALIRYGHDIGGMRCRSVAADVTFER